MFFTTGIHAIDTSILDPPQILQPFRITYPIKQSHPLREKKKMIVDIQKFLKRSSKLSRALHLVKCLPSKEYPIQNR